MANSHLLIEFLMVNFCRDPVARPQGYQGLLNLKLLFVKPSNILVLYQEVFRDV